MDAHIFYRETEFKDTEIGRVPKDWTVVRLGNYVDLMTGYPFRSQEFSPDMTCTKLVRGMNVTRGRLRWEEGITKYWKNITKELEKYLVKKDDLLIGMDGALVGKNYALVDENDLPMLLVQRVARLRAKNGLNKKYLFYFIGSNHFVRYVDKVNTSSGIAHISSNQINDFRIPWAPVQEQQEIAGILSTVDEAIQKTNEIIVKTELLKTGLMQQFLTRGIGHKEFKYSDELGFEIPNEWDVIALSKAFKLASGKTRPSEISEIPTQEMKFPVYGGNGIMGYTNDYLVDEDVIVIGRVGEYCGAVHKAPRCSWITDNALYTTKILHPRLDLDYLRYLLSKLNLNRLKNKTGQPLMTQQIVYSVQIPLPSLSEQQKLARILSTLDAKLQLERNEKAKLGKAKQGLMDLLLTGKIRIRVD